MNDEPIHRTEEKDSYSLSRDEIEALWTYHHEAEFKHADRGEYGDAQYHKTRAAFWRERMANG